MYDSWLTGRSRRGLSSLSRKCEQLLDQRSQNEQTQRSSSQTKILSRYHRRNSTDHNAALQQPVFILLLIACLPCRTVAIPSKYETAYACEGKTLQIECDSGDVINLIRANYGRFSITICNDHGNVDWSVNCMSPKSLRVLHAKCAHRQSCSVLASTNQFGDPCPGTHKYLEAHYQCMSAAATSTTTARPSPPWLITSQPSVWSTSTMRVATTQRVFDVAATNTSDQSGVAAATAAVPSTKDKNIAIINSRRKSVTSPSSTAAATSVVMLPPAPTEMITNSSTNFEPIDIESDSTTGSTEISMSTISAETSQTVAAAAAAAAAHPPPSSSSSSSSSIPQSTPQQQQQPLCDPRTARNLFWNSTRAGDVNVQPCPGGATGIAKWRCVIPPVRRNSAPATTAQWLPATPDLTHCRSLWLNSLEVRVNQPDSSIVSIATDLSQVTSSKTLYGGDMLVTTKIIQAMSEKMTSDIETYPDQRQREAVVLELLHGVVRTGSNLLDGGQLLSWLDLSVEDQMRVATSLLTGLEDNAFLLAETVIRERQHVHKVKNILLSVRVLETRNIVGNEIFPDPQYEQWPISGDTIELPRGALIENSEGGLVRIVFVAFDRLETILTPTGTPPPIVTTQSATASSSSTTRADEKREPHRRRRLLNSKVISASLGKGRHVQLSQPIRLTLRHLKLDNVTAPACVFWNYIDHAWSEDGCYVEATNRTHTICMCNHLTNFAILADVIDVGMDGAGGLNGAIGGPGGGLFSAIDPLMQWLIYGSIIVCAALATFALISQRLRRSSGAFVKSSRSVIGQNQCICVLAVQLLFGVAISLSETSWLCGFTAAFLHCAHLATAAWLFCDAAHLRRTLTQAAAAAASVTTNSSSVGSSGSAAGGGGVAGAVTATSTGDEIILATTTSESSADRTARCIWYYLLTYGLTFTVVAIALAIDPGAYTQADCCAWPEAASGALFAVAFVTPIVAFIVATIVVSTISAWQLFRIGSGHPGECRRSLKENKEHAAHVTVSTSATVSVLVQMLRIQLYSTVAFSFVVFTCWSFGYAYMAGWRSSPNVASMSMSSSTLLGYIFASLNVLQGVYLFSYHCLRSGQIRRDCCRQMANAACWPATCCSDQIRSKESGGIVSQSIAVDNEPTTVNASATLQRFPQQRSIGAAGGGGTLRGIYPESTTTTTAAVAVAAAISPSGSSAGSTHLIYNQAEWMYPSLEHRHHHQQQQHQHRANETMDLYYQKKKKRGGNNCSTMAGSTAITTDPIPKEYFYWTEKRLAAASADGGGGGGDLGDVYPSYRKKIPTTEQDEHHQPIANYMRCEAENVENAEDYDEDEDDDEEDDDVDENTGLDHADQMRNMLRYQQQQQQQQQFRPGFPLATHPVDGYFNQYEAGNYGPDEPVYEEIMSTRGGGGGSGGHTLRDEHDDDAAAAYRNRLLRLQHLQQQQHHHAEQNIRQSNRTIVKPSGGFEYGVDTASNPHQHHQPSRNLSAMLNQKNTVICYLEPK